MSDEKAFAGWAIVDCDCEEAWWEDCVFNTETGRDEYRLTLYTDLNEARAEREQGEAVVRILRVTEEGFETVYGQCYSLNSTTGDISRTYDGAFG